MEQVYYNIWRGHKMSLPILGEIENIYAITRDMIVDYHQRMYFGENMIICASGCVEHEQICDLAEQHFGRLQRNSGQTILNMDKPVYRPGMLYNQDETLQHQNLGVFWEVPGWGHEDFFKFLLLQKIMGTFDQGVYADQMQDVQWNRNIT